MMRKLVIGVSLFLGLNLSAQDIHFSQVAQTPLFINPAAAGVYDGWERVIINHRNQWLGAGTQFMTSAIAADANFFKSKFSRKESAHLGVGLLFYNDIGGDSRFGNQTGALTLSGILPLGYGHTLSAGIQGGFGNRSADFTNLTFASQWNGGQFDQNILSGEANGNSFRYAEASAGLYYTFNGGKSTFKRNEDLQVQVGLAGFHLNRPQLQYTTSDGDRMYRKFVGHAGIVADIPGTKLAIDANIVQFIQGPHFQTIFGATARYRLSNGTKVTGYSRQTYVGFGMYHRLRDAVGPTFVLELGGFKFGLSYDVTVSTMRKAYTGGSLEFSLSYTNWNNSLWKKRR